MPTLLSRGNLEMTDRIQDEGTPTLKDMWSKRDQNLLPLYRVCSPTEAFETWMYCLAGGKYRPLTASAPSEMAAVNQVGNSESMPSGGGGVDPRLAVLAKLGITPSAPPPREVVEYSHQPALQFKGALIRVWVNKSFTRPGSGLSFEGGGGVIVQIGTPLSAVETERSNVDASG